MLSVLLSLALVAAQPVSASTDQRPPMPAAETSNVQPVSASTDQRPPMPAAETSNVAASLNVILETNTGKTSDVADGTWLVLLGDERINPEELSAISLATVTSIDVLTRPNGKYQGTVVLSVSE